MFVTAHEPIPHARKGVRDGEYHDAPREDEVPSDREGRDACRAGSAWFEQRVLRWNDGE
jgi:hypothetical protein